MTLNKQPHTPIALILDRARQGPPTQACPPLGCSPLDLTWVALPYPHVSAKCQLLRSYFPPQVASNGQNHHFTLSTLIKTRSFLPLSFVFCKIEYKIHESRDLAYFIQCDVPKYKCLL